MADKILGIFGTLAIVAFVTTLVLPGRQGPQLVNSIFGGFSNAARASEGIA